jgi:hypothetical protein
MIQRLRSRDPPHGIQQQHLVEQVCRIPPVSVHLISI